MEFCKVSFLSHKKHTVKSKTNAVLSCSSRVLLTFGYVVNFINARVQKEPPPRDTTKTAFPHSPHALSLCNKTIDICGLDNMEQVESIGESKFRSGHNINGMQVVAFH